jgi:hypothetical protein
MFPRFSRLLTLVVVLAPGLLNVLGHGGPRAFL